MAYANPGAWYIDSGPTIGVTDLGTASNAAGATLTLALSCPAASLVVVCVNEATATSAGTSSLSDGTNTYTAGPSVALGGSQGFAQTFYYYYSGAQSGLTLTYTKATTGHTCCLSALYASGIASSTSLDSAVSATAAGTTTTPTVTSGTPSQSGDLIIGYGAWGGASAQTFALAAAPPAFLAPPTAVTTQAAACGGGGSFQYCATGTITFTGTLSGSVTGNGLIVLGFKPSSAPSEYYGVTAWPASTSKSPGALVRQNLTPTVGNERVFVSAPTATGTGAHNTGSTEPTWVITKGGQVVDNTNITWQECTGEPGINGDITNCPVWTVSSTPPLGRVIYDVNTSSLQICSTSGAGGSGAAPSFSATAGTVTADSSAKWTSLGAASNFTKWSAPHARIANAVAANWGAAGNTFFVGDDHAATQASALTITVPGAPNTVTPLYCVDHTASVPPGSANVTTGAKETTTGANALVITSSGGSGSNAVYFNGFSFTSGSGGTGASLNLGNSVSAFLYDNCVVGLGAYGGTAVVTSLSAVSVTLRNTPISFGAAGQSIEMQDQFTWKNTISAIQGTAPTNLFIYQNPVLNMLEGIDLSASANTIVNGNNSNNRPSRTWLINCKLNASATIASGLGSGGFVYLTNTDSAGDVYRQDLYSLYGSVVASTSLVRTGGASDGVTPISWNLTTGTTGATWLTPLEAYPIAIWNSVTGTNRNVTLYGLWNSASLPNNDQIWIDVEYLGSASSPLASLQSETKANGLATGSALTADSTSVWGSAATARQNSHAYSTGNVIAVADATAGGQIFFCTSGGTSAGSEPGGYASAVDGGSVTDGGATFRAATRFQLSVTLSAPQPQLAGYLRATVKAALASTTFYVDPLLNLS